ncbi:MAG: hypothetical protein Q9213_001825 [Squamulea squamosa]
MRLIHTQTLEFGDFLDSQLPPYAILSHRWGEQEISYKEMRKIQKNSLDVSAEEQDEAAPGLGPGMAKIKDFCRKASENGFDWGWIDTCCIDKRSSAELSESINAMYKWYARSAECYVHLSDFALSVQERQFRLQYGKDAWFSYIWPTVSTKFRESSWFTRGWTLQELLAPSNIAVFDANWYRIGSLDDLLEDVIRITGIPKDVLSFDRQLIQLRPIHRAKSVARLMSWASRRQTSREEDIAYCLLGLFNVNMPLLYGEGAENAFYRLQIEIMKISDDESLFAWTSDQWACCVLANSPACFADSWNIVKGSLSLARRPYAMTNKGLEIAVPRSCLPPLGSMVKFSLHLNCFRQTDSVDPIERQRSITLQLRGGVLADRGIANREDCNTLEGPEAITLGELCDSFREEVVVTHIFDVLGRL